MDYAWAGFSIFNWKLHSIYIHGNALKCKLSTLIMQSGHEQCTCPTIGKAGEDADVTFSNNIRDSQMCFLLSHAHMLRIVISLFPLWPILRWYRERSRRDFCIIRTHTLTILMNVRTYIYVQIYRGYQIRICHGQLNHVTQKPHTIARKSIPDINFLNCNESQHFRLVENRWKCRRQPNTLAHCPFASFFAFVTQKKKKHRKMNFWKSWCRNNLYRSICKIVKDVNFKRTCDFEMRFFFSFFNVVRPVTMVHVRMCCQ